MSIFKNSLRDDRVREYLFTTRVMLHDHVEHSEDLLHNSEIQPEISDIRQRCVMHPNGSLLLDFGIELHGGIRIINSSRTPSRVRIRFGESVSEAMGTPNQDHAIHDTVLDVPKMGFIEYGNTAFRFVRIDTLDTELTLINIAAVAIYRDLERVGTFHSSDARINQIYDTSVHTLQLNMQDYIYDGVKRDRLVWMGDLNPEIRGILSIFSDTSLIPKSLDFIRDLTPLPNLMNNISSYSMWWIINQYEYYWYTADINYLKQQQEYLVQLTTLLSSYIDENGAETVPNMRFLDWQNFDNPGGTHAGLQGLMLWTFQAASKLYKILELNNEAPLKIYEKLKKHIPDCGSCKSAAAVMTISGLADRRDVLQKDPFNNVSTFYGYYILLAMDVQDSLELLRHYWGGMIDYGATTFWEDFDLKWLKNTTPITEFPVAGKDDLHADFGNYCYKGLRHSLCHGWASGPAPFLLEKVLGVQFLTPGGSKIAIHPNLGDLEFVSGSVPTIYGKIEVYANRSGVIKIKAPDTIEIVTSQNAEIV